jgi:hypothetical protein
MNKLNETLLLTEFQQRVEAWNRHNFPNQQPYQSVLGMTEEFCHEALSCKLIDDDFDDAIGDTMVYLADYCFQSGIDLASAADNCRPTIHDSDELNINPMYTVIRSIGMLAHAQLKGEQKIRGDQTAAKFYAVGLLVCALFSYARRAERNLHTAMWDALKHIEKRDWIKYPTDGVSN